MNDKIIKALLLWTGLTIFGVAIVIFIPEDILGDKQLFTLSNQHGPTVSEAIGIGFVLVGWLNYLWQIWRRRSLFTNRKQALLCVYVAVASVAGCLAAAVYNYNFAIGVFALLATAAQLRIGVLVGASGKIKPEKTAE